ncbi:MAG TPA: amino acid permease [Vicinamibacterales bacterium]|nr:amino acid permease [Vicinamibacterales bacterium]
MIPESDAPLIRGIGVWSATLLVITNVIGSAIFLTPGSMAAVLPSEPLLLLAWVAGGVIALCGGLTYAEMGAMYPRSGGLYVFLERAYGPFVAFLFGWASMLVIVTGGAATVAVGFAKYFSYFVPAVSTANQVIAVAMPWGRWSISAGQIVAAASILALGAVNYFGVRSGNRLQVVLTVLKLAALIALPVVALALHPVTPSLTPFVPHVPRPAAAFGVVMIAVMWAYEGWYYLPFCAGEIADPRRAIPRALVLGILALTGIYVTVNIAYMLALPLSAIQGVERIAEKAVSALVGPSGATIVAATVVVSTLGCNAATVIAMSRACYAMAADGLFFESAAAVHPRYRTPHVAIAMTCAWSALLALTGTYEQLFTWVTFASVTFGVLGGLAIFRLRRLEPDTPRPYHAWGYPAVPVVFVLGLGALVVNTLIERPIESVVGVLIVALGAPAYLYWRPRRVKALRRAEGSAAG